MNDNVAAGTTRSEARCLAHSRSRPRGKAPGHPAEPVS